MLENHWSWGRQIYWGFILFLTFLFLNLFFYDTSLTFKTNTNFIISVITVLITYRALGSFKIFKNRLRLNKQLKIAGGFILFFFLLLLLIEQVPINVLLVIKSKFFLLSTLTALSASLFEESLCRGLFFSGFLGNEVYRSSRYKLTKATLYSSLVFAILHLVNLFGAAPDVVFMQILYTFAGGVFFSVIRITTNGVLYVILLHFILDWSPLIISSQSGRISWIALLGIFIPLMVSGLFYLFILDNQLTEKI